MIKNRFKRILVPLDGSQNSIRGLNEAISLARQCDSVLIGVHVIPLGVGFQQEKFKTYRNHLIKLSKRFFQKAKSTAARNGVEFKENLIYDKNLAIAIWKFAKFKKCDLIVMGARGTTSPKASWLGSVANAVVASSNIPVLIVK